MRGNEPAFPNVFPNAAVGISVRDYFAAAALTGLLANPNLNGKVKIKDSQGVEKELSFDMAAYAMADSMVSTGL